MNSSKIIMAFLIKFEKSVFVMPALAADVLLV